MQSGGLTSHRRWQRGLCTQRVGVGVQTCVHTRGPPWQRARCAPRTRTSPRLTPPRPWEVGALSTPIPRAGTPGPRGHSRRRIAWPGGRGLRREVGWPAGPRASLLTADTRRWPTAPAAGSAPAAGAADPWGSPAERPWSTRLAFTGLLSSVLSARGSRAPKQRLPGHAVHTCGRPACPAGAPAPALPAGQEEGLGLQPAGGRCAPRLTQVSGLLVPVLGLPLPPGRRGTRIRGRSHRPAPRAAPRRSGFRRYLWKRRVRWKCLTQREEGCPGRPPRERGRRPGTICRASGRPGKKRHRFPRNSADGVSWRVPGREQARGGLACPGRRGRRLPAAVAVPCARGLRPLSGRRGGDPGALTDSGPPRSRACEHG